MKRLFSLLMFSLLLLVSATAMAASYGAYPYMRYGANGRDNASLHLIYTQSGIFASVVTYDLQDGNAPMFKGVGMLENGSLVLEDYSFDVGRHGEDTRYFGCGSQPLVCEARVQDSKQVVLLPTVDAREMGITKVSEPDIGGTYRFEGMQKVKNKENFTLSYPNLTFGVVTKCFFYIKLKTRKRKTAYLHK